MYKSLLRHDGGEGGGVGGLAPRTFTVAKGIVLLHSVSLSTVLVHSGQGRVKCERFKMICIILIVQLSALH